MKEHEFQVNHNSQVKCTNEHFIETERCQIKLIFFLNGKMLWMFSPDCTSLVNISKELLKTTTEKKQTKLIF